MCGSRLESVTFVSRFQDSGQVSHPNVCRMNDIGESEAKCLPENRYRIEAANERQWGRR